MEISCRTRLSLLQRMKQPSLGKNKYGGARLVSISNDALSMLGSAVRALNDGFRHFDDTVWVDPETLDGGLRSALR